MKNLYQEVTDRIAHQLEIGVVPWVQPWSTQPGNGMPVNALTGRQYTGCNVVLLWMAGNRGWPTARFLTFKQAKEAGGNVRKGEHGSKVYFVKQLYNKGDTMRDGKVATGPVTMLREYTVFNVAQCDGLRDSVANGKEKPRMRVAGERDATIEEFIIASGAKVVESGDRAFYSVAHDSVTMPAFKSFHTTSDYYAVLFHELGHWTGHKSRLDRNFAGRFGDAQYAAEELVAELTSAFLCADFAIDGVSSSAGYIDNWMTLLRHDSKAFFTAASAATKAAEYLRSAVLAEQEEAA